MKYTIREMYPQESRLLADFFFCMNLFSRGRGTIRFGKQSHQPELQVYIKDFGTSKDDAACAQWLTIRWLCSLGQKYSLIWGP